MKHTANILEKIREMIDQKVWLRTNTGNPSIILEENKPDAKLKKLEINHLPEHFFGFKLDFYEPNRISAYFAPIENINQGCDGILFVEFEEKRYIIFCELKSSDQGKKDYFPQFQNTNCFVDFLEILLKEYQNLDFQAFERKFILFYRDKSIETSHALVNFRGKSVIIPAIRNQHKIRKFAIKYSEHTLSLDEILRK